MSVISIPTAVAASVGGQTYGQVRYEIMETSEPTGASAVRVLGPPRWRFGLRSKQACSLADGGEWEGMLLRLRGGVNHLGVYDFLRPAPQGNARGATVLNASVAIGDTSLTLAKVRVGVQMLEETVTFNGTSWTLTSVSVTANTTLRPYSLSSSTADTITDASGTVVGFLSQAATVANDAATYTGSIYVKKTAGATGAFAMVLRLTGGTTVVNTLQVNTDTGAVISGTGTVTSEDSATWWRVSQTITNNTTGNTVLGFEVYPARNTNPNTGFSVAATGSAIVWGAQLEAGSTLTAYDNTRTLNAGDWLQVGTAGVGTSQLVKVVTSASSTATDVLTVSFEPPLRYAFSAGAVVAWDKPLAYCKMSNDSLTWAARANGPAIDSFAVDLLEDWGP